MQLGHKHQSVTRALENNLSYSKKENRHWQSWGIVDINVLELTFF